MGEEPLVKEPLTEQMIKAGAELTRRLDQRNWPVTASFWYFVPEENQWKLIFATPRLLTHGPAVAYYSIRLAVSGQLREQFVNLKQIVVVPPNDEVVRALGLAINTGWTISGIRFSHNTINGRFIEDAYVYRIAQPHLSDRPIWFEPTPQIRALNGKSVLVRNLTNNSEKSATLRISDGNPQTVYAGKCSVAVEQATVGNLKWTDAGGTTPPPTEQIRVWRAFLNEAAVALLCTNNESPEYGELWLELAYTE